MTEGCPGPVLLNVIIGVLSAAYPNWASLSFDQPSSRGNIEAVGGSAGGSKPLFGCLRGRKRPDLCPVGNFFASSGRHASPANDIRHASPANDSRCASPVNDDNNRG